MDMAAAATCPTRASRLNSRQARDCASRFGEGAARSGSRGRDWKRVATRRAGDEVSQSAVGVGLAMGVSGDAALRRSRDRRSPSSSSPRVRATACLQGCSSRVVGSQRPRRAIRCAIRLRRICSKAAMTSGRFRNCSGIRTWQRRWCYTHVLNRGGSAVRSPLDG